MGVLGRLVMMPNPFIKLLELTGLGLGPANSDEALNGLADSMAAGGAAMADLFWLTKAQIQRITPYFRSRTGCHGWTTNGWTTNGWSAAFCMSSTTG
jgi:hypothetical protein